MADDSPATVRDVKGILLIVNERIDEINGKQPLDEELTEIAALTPGDGDLLMYKAGAWVSRTAAQYRADRAAAVPAFNATIPAKLVGVTGDGTSYVIPFGSVTQQGGSNYNTGTGRFTAPVNGYYHFSTGILLEVPTGTTFTVAHLKFVIAGGPQTIDYRGGVNIAPGGNDYLFLQGSSTVYLASGQGCEVELTVSGPAKTINVTQDGGVRFSRFSGHMVAG